MSKTVFTRCASIITTLVLALFLQGCATNLRQPKAPPQPTSKKLSTFQAVQMKAITISPAFAKAGANQKAAKKINENLVKEMKLVLPNLLDADKPAAPGTLVITPVIEEIKFIGGFARFMVGGMAGSSAVLMKVTYTDADSGAVVGDPEFYRAANAFGGAYSMGATDNMMLAEIARDIASYTKMNL